MMCHHAPSTVPVAEKATVGQQRGNPELAKTNVNVALKLAVGPASRTQNNAEIILAGDEVDVPDAELEQLRTGCHGKVLGYSRQNRLAAGTVDRVCDALSVVGACGIDD